MANAFEISRRRENLIFRHHQEVASIKKTSTDANGKRHYGDGLYKRAAEITGLTGQTLMDFVWMANAFEFSLRNENLMYNHHREVASIRRHYGDGLCVDGECV